jgi:hypothetical protein
MLNEMIIACPKVASSTASQAIYPTTKQKIEVYP